MGDCIAERPGSLGKSARHLLITEGSILFMAIKGPWRPTLDIAIFRHAPRRFTRQPEGLYPTTTRSCIDCQKRRKTETNLPTRSGKISAWKLVLVGPM